MLTQFGPGGGAIASTGKSSDVWNRPAWTKRGIARAKKNGQAGRVTSQYAYTFTRKGK